MSDLFEDFWRAFPHRPRCRNRMEAEQLWNGKLKLANGSRIIPLLWPRIVEGARAYAEIAGADDYRWNVCRWLRNGGWEDALEEAQESRADGQALQRRSESRAQGYEREGRHARAAWERRANGNVVNLPNRANKRTP